MRRNYPTPRLSVVQCFMPICSVILLIFMGISPIYAEDAATENPAVTFTIPAGFDENCGLNTSENARTPSSLYTHPNYSNDVLKSIFSDFAGQGPITYNLCVIEDLKDADGADYYPYWLLGNEVSGGEIDLIFRPTYIAEHGVYINKVIIKNAQNRFSKEELNITINGQNQKLGYTPNPKNISAGEECSVSSRDMIFDFDGSPVERLSISASGHGLGFSSIEMYVGAENSSDVSHVMADETEPRYFHIDGTPAKSDDNGLIIVVYPGLKSEIKHNRTK